jgi:hypothetical protein
MLYIQQKKLKLSQSEREIKNKKNRYKLRLRFVAPAQEAKNVAPLSSIFGQFGINCLEFCKKFNEESASYTAGLILVVYLDMAEDRSFQYTIKQVFFSEFILSVATDNTISVLDLLRLGHVYANLYKLSLWSSITTILGTLKSTRIKTLYN